MPKPWYSGGAERLIVDAAVELATRGHNVHVFTSHHEKSRCFEETVSGTGFSLFFATNFILFYFLAAFSFLGNLDPSKTNTVQVSFRLQSMVPSYRGMFSIVFTQCVHIFGVFLLRFVYCLCILLLILYSQIRSLLSFHSWSWKSHQRFIIFQTNFEFKII